MRGVGWTEIFVPFGAAVSAVLHGSILGVVLLGWPVLTFLFEDSWFSPDEYIRVDVVLYSMKENPEVAKDEGVVSFETETIGKGQAKAPGRAYGPLATNSRVPLTKPNTIAKHKSAPDAPSKASESAKSETRREASENTPENAPTGSSEASKAETGTASTKAAQSIAKQGEAERQSTSAAGQRQSGTSEASGANVEPGSQGTSKSNAPPSERADSTTRPAQGQTAEGEEAARVQAAQSEAQSPDRPKGRDDATQGAAAEGSESAEADGKSPVADKPAEPPQDGAETGRIEAEANQPEQKAGATESRRQSTAENTGASVSDGRASPEASAAAPSEQQATGTAAAGREANSNAAPDPEQAAGLQSQARPDVQAPSERADRSQDLVERIEARLTRIASLLDLPGFSESAAGAPDAAMPLPLSEVGEVFASRPGANADDETRLAPISVTTSKERQTAETRVGGVPNPVDPQKLHGNAPPPPQLAQAGQTPIRNLPLRLLVQSMPGVDEALVRAIDNPESAPEHPVTPRRKQVVDRIAAAAERGYIHAQYGMARRYLMGQGVPRDPAKGAEWLHQAAEQGHATSQLLLGYLAARGYGRNQNMADAMMWWTLAADTGDPNAASAARIAEPTLDSEDLLEARRNVNSWRAAFGQVDETDNTGGDNTPQDTPLQEAVAAGDLSEVHSVLARGEDANGRDIDGRTALINAGWRGDANITETLLEVGADPDVIDLEGKSALIWAASNGNLSVVALLAEAGAELDLQDKKGLTALMRAAWNGRTKVVETLLRVGADPNLKDNNGLTAADHAQREQFGDIVGLLKAAAN